MTYIVEEVEAHPVSPEGWMMSVSNAVKWMQCWQDWGAAKFVARGNIICALTTQGTVLDTYEPEDHLGLLPVPGQYCPLD